MCPKRSARGPANCTLPLKERLTGLQVDKHAIVAELGIHYRDLRILDPLVGLLAVFDVMGPANKPRSKWLQPV